MSKDSILLIDDKTLRSGTGYAAALSLLMLAMFKASERREPQWRRLLEEAGFRVCRISCYSDFGDSIIFAMSR